MPISDPVVRETVEDGTDFEMPVLIYVEVLQVESVV